MLVGSRFDRERFTVPDFVHVARHCCHYLSLSVIKLVISVSGVANQTPITED